MPKLIHPDLPDTQEPFEAPDVAVEHWQSLGWEVLEDAAADEPFADYGHGTSDSPDKGDDDDLA